MGGRLPKTRGVPNGGWDLQQGVEADAGRCSSAWSWLVGGDEGTKAAAVGDRMLRGAAGRKGLALALSRIAAAEVGWTAVEGA